MHGMMDYAKLMEPVAREILGEPNRALSSKRELRYGSGGSMKINLADGLFHDFEADQRGGVKKFLVHTRQISTEEEADEWLRDHGYLPPKMNGQASGQKSGGRKIAAVYDYKAADGTLLYQVVRYDPKTFAQRRPSGEPNVWIWGLEAAEYMRRGPGSDWYKFDEERFRERHYTERKKITTHAEHSLYRLGEIAEAKNEGELLFLVEGEKDADSGWKIGAPSTTNSGGAKHWSGRHAEFFRGAKVVVVMDNDRAGREGAEKKAKMLYGIAASVKLLDLSRHWKEMPEKADLTDWIEHGGTNEKLYEIARLAPEWRPDPGSLIFRAINFANITLREGARYLVRGILPMKGILVVWGMRKCGKSFWMLDILLHVALGIEYRGLAVEQGRVIYLVLEGDDDYDARVLAWKMSKLKDAGIPIPFEVIFCRLKLIKDVDRLIDDVRAQFPGAKIAVICIDTLNRSYTGSESSDEDMTAYVDAAETLVRAFNCLVTVVHHCGLDGQRPRGHTALSAAADGQIKVYRQGSEIVAEVEFLKGGRAGTKIRSEEEEVIVGQDSRGGAISSLILVPADDRNPNDPGGFRLRNREETAFQALVNAIKTNGSFPPIEIKAPPGALAVTYEQWRAEFVKITEIAREDEKKFEQSVKQALARAGRTFLKFNLIGRENPFIWRTTRRVMGFNDIPEPKIGFLPEYEPLPEDFLK